MEGMKMKAGIIFDKAQKLGGTFSAFKQEGGNCAGWVAHWIRKMALSKTAWEPKYFDRMVSHTQGGFVMWFQTDEGLEKAKSLMAVQLTAYRDGNAIKQGIENVLGHAKAALTLSELAQDTVGMAKYKKEIAELEDLKHRMSDRNFVKPKMTGWMKDYVTKKTKAGAQPVQYVRLDGDFTKGQIGQHAEGLKKLHAGCDKKIVYVALERAGEKGHAVGFHRLSDEGWRVLIDPNIGSVVLRNHV
jgi:hypothetical protein